MGQSYDYQVAVIGAGPGGYVAAVRAAQRGASVCLIERGELGGTCTNAGCIPTKVLWQSALMLDDARTAADFGLKLGEPQIDFAAVADRRDAIVGRMRAGISALLKARGVELIPGSAAFTGPHTLCLESEAGSAEISADRIIVATGSVPIELPAAPFDHERIIDSTDAVLARELPASVAVLGGGYIGVEFAGIYASCGVQVAVVEALDRLLPGLDVDCAREVAKALKKAGVKALTGLRLEEARVDGEAVHIRLSDGQEISAGTLLVCVGRRPSCQGLDVEKAGLKTGERGELPVNEHMQTAVEHVYAIGDVAGKAMLAHTASHEALVAAAHATGDADAAMDYAVVPACVFAFPEVATVGLTEEQAREQAGDVVVKKFPMRALGKAHISGHVDGLVKMVAEKQTGRLLGVHIVAAAASCLLGEATLALKMGCTAEQLADTIHAHPTLPEALREAADGVVGMPVNWLG